MALKVTMGDRSPTLRWLLGLHVQARVIRALMMRDALSRYGHENLGFFWLIAEPLLLTGGIMIVWSTLRLSHSAQVEVIPFALTGYSFITLWRHIVSRSISVINSNITLSYHRQIGMFDVIMARAGLETVGIFAAFIVSLLPLWLLGFCPGIRDPLPLVGGFAFGAWFSFGVGMILAGLSEISELVEHFIQPVMYLTIPLTGIFFMVDWLPPGAQGIVQWSPLVNAMEMFRSGLFDDDVTTHWSSLYLLVCCSIATASGLIIYRFALRHQNN